MQADCPPRARKSGQFWVRTPTRPSAYRKPVTTPPNARFKRISIRLCQEFWIQDLPVGHYFARWGGVVYKGIFPFLPEPGVSEAELDRILKGRYMAGEAAHA
jgi:hypothetical protein